MTIAFLTPLSNIELMRTAFAALGRKDADAVVALMPPDFLINIAGMPYQKQGTDAWRKHAEILFSAFPDLQVKVEDIFGAEDKVTVRLRISGTHAGEFLGIQPTGILRFQERVDAARERLDDKDLTKSELDDLGDDLEQAMPKAVRRELPGYAERPDTALKGQFGAAASSTPASVVSPIRAFDQLAPQ